MRIVLDTNVFISGIFFTGPPYQILKAWRDGEVQLLVSQSILDEYQRIGVELSLQFRDVDLKPFLDLLTIKAEIVLAPALPPVIHDDPSVTSTGSDLFIAYGLRKTCFGLRN